MSLGFVLLCLWAAGDTLLLLLKSYYWNRVVLVEKDYISAPKSIASNEQVKIYYKHLFQVKCISGYQTPTALVLFSKRRKQLTIPKHLLRSSKDFDQLCAVIQERMEKNSCL